MSEDSPNYVDSLCAKMAMPVIDDINTVPVIVLPEGFRAYAMPDLLELNEPTETRRDVVANDLRGFVDYINKYKWDRTSIYADAFKSPKLIALLDDHTATAASHVDHKVVFNCPHTYEWSEWTRLDKKPVNQIEFAQFIENNIKDIISPTGSELLESVLNFNDTGRAEFKSAVRLSDGRVQFKFHQNDENGEVKFPEELGLALPVFEGFVNEDSAVIAYPITAKLRYRVRDEQLSIWYELQRPDIVMRKAYEDVIERVKAETEIHVIRAMPGANKPLSIKSPSA